MPDIIAHNLALGKQLLTQGQGEAAIAAYRLALENCPSVSINYILCLDGLGKALYSQGQLPEATEHFRKSLAIMRQLFDKTPELAGALQNLAKLLSETGEIEEATTFAEEAVAILKDSKADEPRIATALLVLSFCYYSLKDFNKAEISLNQAKQIWEKIDPYSFEMSICLNNLGRIYEQYGQCAQGALYHAKAVEIRQKLLGDHPETAFSLGNYGAALAGSKDWKKAIEVLESALACYTRLNEEDCPGAEVCRTNLHICQQAFEDEPL